MTRSGEMGLGRVPGLVMSVVLVLALLPALAAIPGGLELHLTLVQENRPLLVLPLEPGERFTLHYYHSVEKAPIWEEHSLDRTGKIYIEEERYEKFGAGMGKMPGVGRMVTRGIYEAIIDMHYPVGDFILRVGNPGVDHTLIWRDRQFHLSETLAHKAILFSGKRVGILNYLRRSLGSEKGFSPKGLIQSFYPEEHNGGKTASCTKEYRN